MQLTGADAIKKLQISINIVIKSSNGVQNGMVLHLLMVQHWCLITITDRSITRADIGKDHANYNLLNGHVKRIMYYPKRLPNNQLVTLTS